jgi:hypothetical protein
MVKFCAKCRNIYQYCLDESGDSVICKCNYCGFVDDTNHYQVESIDIGGGALDYNVTTNIVHDHTFPRTTEIICPNDCNKAEIIIFQVNPQNYKSGYYCTECQTKWQ